MYFEILLQTILMVKIKKHKNKKIIYCTSLFITLQEISKLRVFGNILEDKFLLLNILKLHGYLMK